jgi:hypothetical protein
MRGPDGRLAVAGMGRERDGLEARRRDRGAEARPGKPRVSGQENRVLGAGDEEQRIREVGLEVLEVLRLGEEAPAAAFVSLVGLHGEARVPGLEGAEVAAPDDPAGAEEEPAPPGLHDLPDLAVQPERHGPLPVPLHAVEAGVVAGEDGRRQGLFLRRLGRGREPRGEEGRRDERDRRDADLHCCSVHRMGAHSTGGRGI